MEQRERTHRSYSDVWVEFLNTANAHPDQTIHLNSETGVITFTPTAKAA